MDQDAIHQDVSEEEVLQDEVHHEEETQLSDRDQKFQQIVEARAKEGLKEEPGPQERPAEEEDDDGPTIDFVVGEKVYKVPASAKYRAKIDGEETEAEIDKITRSYQKGAAADRRLEEATRKQKELAEYEQALAQRLQAIKESEQREQRPPVKGDNKKIAERIYRAVLDEYENPIDEIANALGEFSIDEESIIRKAEDRASRLMTDRERAASMKAAEAKRADANQWFTDTYPDIVGDQHLLGRAMQMGAEKLKLNPDGDYKAMVKEIGDELTEWMKGKTPSLQTREKPKPSPQPRTAVPPKKEEVRQPTRADILAEMRRSRGLPN